MVLKEWLAIRKDYPLYLLKGDKIILAYTDKNGTTTEVLEHITDRDMSFNEARIFSAEVEGRNALGGVFIEKDKK